MYVVVTSDERVGVAGVRNLVRRDIGRDLDDFGTLLKPRFGFDSEYITQEKRLLAS
jgi:hypothetical protein